MLFNFLLKNINNYIDYCMQVFFFYLDKELRHAFDKKEKKYW